MWYSGDKSIGCGENNDMVDLTEILDKPLPTTSYFDLTYKLLNSLCRSTEQGIQQNIEDYQNNGAEFVEVDHDPQYGPIGFEHYNNITHFDVLDLDDTVTIHFPSMQRRSVLLTIFGIFEHELEEFCKAYAKKYQLKVKVSDFKGSGIERSTTYIKKVLEISVPSSELRKVQVLRNACAHQDAKYMKPDGQRITEIVALVNEQSAFLELDSLENKVIVKTGFLDWVLKLFKNYFQALEQQLKDRA
ncbi:hypothetical protein VME0621_03871 [Vibrio mediterranei]|uniref:hypothetical protein n=1 Tax=Vibrio mediterranei TaxID=689 RepID=UPI000782129F|nr:hypothetical protein [Vibrio mediterranei]SBO11735.1 hypothetical protein VME0621_03871 [Vibrio mediterranei]